MIRTEQTRAGRGPEIKTNRETGEKPFMILTKAEGRGFRNYASFSLSVPPAPIHFLTGGNGQGKTSFLEAVFAALRGRSFKPATGCLFIKEGESQAFVRLFFRETESGSVSSVESAFSSQEGRLVKETGFCGKKVSRSFLEKRFPLLCWTSDHLQTVKGGSSEKRKLLDEMLRFEGASYETAQFQKCLKEKSALLLNLKKGLCSLKEAESTLRALNPLFLKASFDLTEKRLSLLKKVFAKAPQFFSAFYERSFQYKISGRAFTALDEAARSLMTEDLFEKAGEELQAGRVLSGAGRHDILFLFEGKDARTFCSQGQQRVFILSLLMAQALSFEKPPLILLDDVLSELDAAASGKLLSFLQTTGSQSFITSCAPLPPAVTAKTRSLLKNAAFYKVKNGSLTLETNG